MKIVIVGGVAGGATAAARLRRLSEKDTIIIFEKDEYVSYANCGLPYYIGGVITDKQRLQVQTVRGLSERMNLDVRINSKVIGIDTAAKTVTVKNVETDSVYEESFDKLILSCGAKPIRPPIKGLSTADNVFTLKNIADTYAIKDFTEENTVTTAAVVGGGFIGIETAENLARLGIKVTLIEKAEQVLRPFDFEMAQIVHRELISKGVDLILSDGVEAFEDGGKTIVLESGRVIDTHMTVLAIGVKPASAIAKNAGILTSQSGFVQTDDNFNVYSSEGEILRDIYAVGDMIEVTNPLDDSKYSVPLAWGANRQGRLVADAINGIKIKKSKILGASALKVFDLTAASVGANETVLNQKGIDFLAVHAHRPNHATYYPGASIISLKLLFDPKNGRIFGAQAIGQQGTEKRIDVISTVMRLNGTVFDLSDLELCYAPPYSSAKDPVNILGYISENLLAGAFELVRHDQIDEIVADGGLLIDVRTPYEFKAGHIDGAVNIEVDVLREKLAQLEISKDTPVYLTCQVGFRANLAVNILKANGYTRLYNLSGGYITYVNYKYGCKENAAPEIKC